MALKEKELEDKEVRDEKEEDIELIKTVLSENIDEYDINVTGNMPEGAVLVVSKVDDVDALEDVINDETFTACAAFDIEIQVDDKVWQPVDFAEIVTITVKGTEIEEDDDKELAVYRIEEDDDKDVTELEASVNDDGEVIVETEHFTMYVFGTKDVNINDGLSKTVDANKDAYLIPGSSFNEAVKGLNNYFSDIVWTSEEFESDTNLSEEGAPVYARLAYVNNDAVIELYTEAENVYLNETSSYMFYTMHGLKHISMLSDKINTESVTSMYDMFSTCSNLEDIDLSRFVTKNVTTMDHMFNWCPKLQSINLETFDTSKVTDFGCMFWNCQSLTSLDLSSFNTSSARLLFEMFRRCKNLKSIDLSGFDVTKNVYFNGLFQECESLEEINLPRTGCWNNAIVTLMFKDCKSLTQIDMSGFDMSNVTEADGIFEGCDSLKVIKASDSIGDVTISLPEIEGMGWYLDDDHNNEADSSTDYVHWVVPENTAHTYILLDKIANEADLIYGQAFNVEIKNLADNGTHYEWSDKIENTITDIIWTSEKFTSDVNLSNSGAPVYARKTIKNNNAIIELYTPAETVHFHSNSGSMFERMEGLTQISMLLSDKIDTEKVSDFSNMFNDCRNLETLDISNFEISNESNTENMLSNCQVLKKVKAPKTIGNVYIVFPTVNNNTWHIDDIEPLNAADDSRVFSYAMMDVTNTPHTYIRSDIDGFMPGPSETLLVNGTAFNIRLRNLVGSGTDLLNEADTKITKIEWTDTAFESDITLNEEYCAPIYAKFDNGVITLYTSAKKVYLHDSCSSMFSNMSALESVDLSRFDSSRVSLMQYMFNGCKSLKSLDIKHFDTSNVLMMTGLFSYCESLTALDVTNFNTENVTNMRSLFSHCTSLKNLDLRGFKTEKVTDFGYMFWGCESLTELDVSSFRTKQANNMASMFSGCIALKKLDLKSFETENIMSMEYMFHKNYALKTLDISSFDISNTENTQNILYRCDDLQTIIAPKDHYKYSVY